MSEFKSEFLHVLSSRGFIHQGTNLEGLDAQLKDNPAMIGYAGFDATAGSLHVGSLVQIMLLRHLQNCGGKPIALMGGGTTMVGDPSGKDEARKLITEEDITNNIQSISTVFHTLLDIGEGADQGIIINNADWLKTLEYINFLRDTGRHFSVNRMLTMDSVRLRLEREQPLSFLEFNYMLLQAYDFLRLYQEYGCKLQLGGSDQWGNIVQGVELVRRVEGAEVFGVTTGLITTASGAKMGKTAAGAVWLNADHLSPYDYWQFWRNTDDADVGRFLKLFTDIPLDEIARLEALEGAEINEAKKVLADAATAMLHGNEAAKQARQAAEQTFEQGQMGQGLPEFQIAPSQLGTVVQAFLLAGLADSKSEVRRLAKGGGLRVNDSAESDADRPLTPDDFKTDNTAKLSFGKKRHALLKLTD